MARKKVKLAFILDIIARKKSYEKRKKGILKKMEELVILCGVEACAIIYSEFDDFEPQIWPSPWEVHNLLAKFRRYPQVEQRKRMFNQESYVRQRVNKTSEQLEKLMRNNREKEVSMLVNYFLLDGNVPNDLSVVDLNDILWFIDEKQKEVNYRRSVLNKRSESTIRAQESKQVADQVVVVAPAAPVVAADEGVLAQTSVDAPQDVPWYLDMMYGGVDENQFMMAQFGDFNYLPK